MAAAEDEAATDGMELQMGQAIRRAMRTTEREAAMEGRAVQEVQEVQEAR